MFNIILRGANIVAPPRGERGLKHGLIGDDEVFDYGRSPSWGAWIETAIARQSRGMKSSRSPSWGAWIEIFLEL